MPYIGHSPTNTGTFYILDEITLGNSAGPYNLTVGGVSVTPKVDNLLIMLDGVVQHAGDAYTISGNQITFSAATASGMDFYGIIMGQAASFAQGSIGADELKVADDGSANQILVSDGDGTFSWATNALNSTHISVADNESTNENNLIPFIEDASATGNVGLESDGDLHYNPSTGKLTATQLAGTLQTAAQGNITSVGTLTSLTSSGNIATSADKRLSVGTWDNSGFSGSAMYGLSITSSVPIVHLTESDETGKKAYFGMSGGNAYLGGNTITNLYFQTGSGTTALTIDSSQVALFASTIRGSADIVAYYSSDPSLKENKELIQSPLDKISQLGGYSFDWKDEARDIVGDHLNGKDYGVMADEVQALFPELVDTRSNGIRAVKYDKLVPLLIEGIKELKEELNMIKEQS